MTRNSSSKSKEDNFRSSCCGTFDDLVFRPLRSSDRDEVVSLHLECFPVRYDDHFFEDAVGGKTVSIAAVRKADPEADRKLRDSCLIHSQRRGRQRRKIDDDDDEEEEEDEDDYDDDDEIEEENEEENDDEEEALHLCTCFSGNSSSSNSKNGENCVRRKDEIVGVLIASVKPSTAFQDVVLDYNSPSRHLMYICTLGVRAPYRNRGIAGELLSQLVSGIGERVDVKAIFLHVLDSNDVAIGFYERNGFEQVASLVDFYIIDGIRRSAYLYALYVNGGKRTWSFGSFFGFIFDLPRSILFHCIGGVTRPAITSA